MPAPRGGSGKIFENLAFSNQRSAFRQNVATLCRPDTRNEKTGLKLTVIRGLKNGEKGFDRSVDRSAEWHFVFVFNKGAMGGGSMAQGRRQRAAKRSGDLVIARDWVIGQTRNFIAKYGSRGQDRVLSIPIPMLSPLPPQC